MTGISGPRHLVLAVIVLGSAAVREEQGDGLGEIQAASAADADHHFAREAGDFRQAVVDAGDRKIGLGTIEHFHGDAGAFQIGQQRVKHGLAAEAGVGAHQGTPSQLGGCCGGDGALS